VIFNFFTEKSSVSKKFEINLFFTHHFPFYILLLYVATPSPLVHTSLLLCCVGVKSVAMNIAGFSSHRPCQYQPKKGKGPCKRLVQDNDCNFCSIHKPLSGERIQCENCNQMIKKGSTTHAQKCSSLALKTTQLPYYCHNCNILSSGCSTTTDEDTHVNEEELATRIESLYLLHAADFLNSSFLDDTISTPDTPSPSPSLKHRRQEDAIVQCMEQHRILNGEPAMYVEFGAGKGSLSKAIGGCDAANVPESLFICIERSAYKHKAENNEAMRSCRARIDLCDVNLSRLVDHAEETVFGAQQQTSSLDKEMKKNEEGEEEEVGEKGEKSSRSSCLGVVGVGKHVCGGATDLSLVALRNFLHAADTETTETTETSPEHSSSSPSSSSRRGRKGRRVKGIALALCCHGLCSWDCYAGRAWLEEVGGFTAAEFEYLRKWSGFFVVDRGQLSLERSQGEG
jgi:hypothetical protein